MNAIIPIPQRTVAIRVATMADLPFLDALQKKHSKQLGYFPTKQFEGYIEGGHVLVAESVGVRQRAAGSEEEPEGASWSSLPTAYCPLPAPSPLGYIISRDRYLKRDELGVIYQLCVAPGHQRGLIGATLVKEVFARSAYGCRLYCCWCAQDLEANYFWESLGFVPIAFRAGGKGRTSGRACPERASASRRVHIFWQRRIDCHPSTPSPQHPLTPWWYPFQTSSGAIREDRIVFPIPPGVHWRDVRPPDVRAVEVPREEGARGEGRGAREEGRTKKQPRLAGPRSPMTARPSPLPHQVGILVGGRIKYVAKPGYVPPVEEKKAKAKREPKAKAPPARIDPKYLAAARELRDRYLERVNKAPDALPAAAGKYDVSRALGARTDAKPLPLLIAAA